MNLNAEHHTILLVEDSPLDVMFLQRAFRELGVKHRLVTVSDGAEAKDYLEGRGPYADRQEFPLPKLILLDLGLPHVNGFEVLQWLRSHETLRHLIVIVLSGSVFSPDIKRSYALGANSFLVKPAGIKELCSTIKSLLDFWLQKASVPDAVPHPTPTVIEFQQPDATPQAEPGRQASAPLP